MNFSYLSHAYIFAFLFSMHATNTGDLVPYSENNNKNPSHRMGEKGHGIVYLNENNEILCTQDLIVASMPEDFIDYCKKIVPDYLKKEVNPLLHEIAKIEEKRKKNRGRLYTYLLKAGASFVGSVLFTKGIKFMVPFLACAGFCSFFVYQASEYYEKVINYEYKIHDTKNRLKIFREENFRFESFSQFIESKENKMMEGEKLLFFQQFASSLLPNDLRHCDYQNIYKKHDIKFNWYPIISKAKT